MLLEQSASLALGHPAPDAEFHPIIQGIGTALGNHRAMPADHGGLPLGGTADEQLVRVGGPTQPLGNPGDPGFPGRQWE